MLSPQIIDSRDSSVFLTAADVPPNLPRLKPGDILHWVRDPRTVQRVGYRKTAYDYMDEAKRLLDTDEGRGARVALGRLVNPGGGVFGAASLHDLPWAMARALASRDRLGGPDRGMLVDERPYALDYRSTPVEVHSTRVVRLGVYYAPSGGWSHTPDGAEYDCENGGLSSPRTVVLVRSNIGEVISGDLSRTAPTPA